MTYSQINPAKAGGFKNKYGEGNREYDIHRSQYKLGLKILSKVQIQGKKVLDVGCGMGEFADILSKKDFQVVCVDGTDRCVKSTRQRGHKCYEIDLENQKLPFKDNEFDIVVSLDVIEHLWNISHYLNEIVRILKPKGYVIITTINYDNLFFRIKHLFGNLGGILSNTRHKKFYNFITFKKEIENYFKVKKSVGLFFYPSITQFITNNKFQNLLSIDIGILGMFKGGKPNSSHS